MKSKLLVLLFLFIASFATGQENKWNVETNYAIVPAAGLGGSDNVIELGVKYRFLQNEILNLGLSFNGGFFSEDTFQQDSDTETHLIFQPRVFSEFHLPFSKRLKPTVGFGYSFLTGFENRTDSFGGFNINLGLSYDITNKWFLQFQYDRVSMKAIDNPEGFNNFRLGIGYRF